MTRNLFFINTLRPSFNISSTYYTSNRCHHLQSKTHHQFGIHDGRRRYTCKTTLKSCGNETKDQFVKLAVSSAIFDLRQQSNPKVLLIERGKEPNKGLWSLPGGSVNEDDKSLIDAAKRELHEETNILPSNVQLIPKEINVVDIPMKGKDLTYKIHVFAGILLSPAIPIASDDAKDAKFCSLEHLQDIDLVASIDKSIKIAYENVIKAR